MSKEFSNPRDRDEAEPELTDLSQIPRSSLEALVKRLVETGQIPAGTVNAELITVMAITEKRVERAADTGSTDGSGADYPNALSSDDQQRLDDDMLTWSIQHPG